MSQSRSGAPKRLVGGLLAALLAVAGFALTAPAAGAATVDRVEDACGRIAGLTRYGTAGDAANAYDLQAGENVDTVIVANGRNYPDALAASALARHLNAPIVLVEPPDGEDRVPLETRAALDNIDPANIVIVGGTAAVSAKVAAELGDRYGTTPQRIAGVDRYETAAEIAREIGDAGLYEGRRTAIVARGDEFADALAGGPLAYHGDGTTPFPLLLTEPNDLNDHAAAALDELNIEQVIVLGGSAAVGPAVRAELAQQTGNPVIALEGVGREETAVEVAEFLRDELGFAMDAVFLARRDLFPDALTGGPLAGLVEAPILLTPTESLHPATAAFLEENEALIQQVIALGGTAAISDDTLEAACEAATVPLEGPPGEPGPQPGGDAAALTLTPDTETNPVGTAHTVTADVDNAEGGPAEEGTLVRFEVYERSGAAGASNASYTFRQGAVDTAENGTADFTYTGPNAPREDLIVSCVVEQQQQSCVTSGNAPQVDPVTGEFTNLREPGDTAGKVWIRRNVAALTLTPDTDVNATGEPHLVTATATDQFGEPVVGQTLLFEVFRDTNSNGLFQFIGETNTNTTNAQGQVTLRYTSTEVGVDRIVVCAAGDCTSTPTEGAQAGVAPNNQTTANATAAGAGSEAAIVVTANPAAQAAKEWISATAQQRFEDEDPNAQNRDIQGTVVACDPIGNDVSVRTNEARVVDVEYEIDDTFIVDGQQRNELGFEAACSAGDLIDIQFRPFGTSTFSLTNQPAPTTPA